MASALPPVRGVAFSFEISLISQADTDTFQDNPTLAAGDVKIIKDGTLDGNIDTLPTAVTSLTRVLTVPLSVDEMTADRVTVLFHDAAGNEWQDAVVTIYTAAQTLDTTDGIADDIKATVNHADYGNAKLVRSTTPANTLDVSATGEAGVDWANVGSPTTLVALTGTQINSVLGTVGSIATDGITAAAVSAAAAEKIAAAVIAGGATTYSYSDTVDDGSGNLLDGVFIQCATDAAFTNIVSTATTNSIGAFTVYDDVAGTHYLRMQFSGITFTDQTVTLA